MIDRRSDSEVVVVVTPVDSSDDRREDGAADSRMTVQRVEERGEYWRDGRGDGALPESNRHQVLESCLGRASIPVEGEAFERSESARSDESNDSIVGVSIPPGLIL